VAWWVDGVMITGKDVREDLKKRGSFAAPPSARLKDQRAQALVFHQLIYNTDPNLGNFVVDQNWKGIFRGRRCARRNGGSPWPSR
ncbi:MAG: hypothetical protein V3T72_05100, partial [Thermoanaerobaculia bacterium]